MLRSAVVLLALVVVAFPGSASAETQVTRDPDGDMVTVNAQGDVVGTAPDQANGDVRRSRITYSHHGIKAVIEFEKLDRPVRRMTMGVDLRWKDAIQYNYGGVVIFASVLRSGGIARFDGDRSCPVEHNVDYASDRVTLSLPSRCLGDPPWIQAWAGAGVRQPPPGASFYFDSAPDDLHYGRRISRG